MPTSAKLPKTEGIGMATYSARLALLTALTCAGLLATALYMEYASGLVPCALCLAQRATFALIGIACLLYLLPFYTSRFIFSLAAFISSTLGVWLASRELWLQSLPEDELPACGPDIYFMIERFPLTESLQTSEKVVEKLQERFREVLESS